ncbi:ilvB operon leader peptide IvbL [Serratia marcescens]
MIRLPVIASSLTSTLLVTALPAAVVVVRMVVVVGNAP